ncbi:MAG: glycosyltransferase family 2 protein [Kiritimatiellae bacterium]|nr:glycosyltransferase family 2 protein [Kiritimatiellia bacterium]MCO5068976.1 glycosyltransferase family 2 protein [Kiritimatiellia bacterium]
MDEQAREPIAVSVCICTFNGAERIPLVLEALGQQTDSTARWDVLVVDNASTDQTPTVVAESLARNLPDRGCYIREEQAGLMYARRTASRRARGEYIAFLDDDNIPAPDYLAKLLALLPLHPNAGVIGGRVWADWVGEPTPLGKAVASFALAVCERGDVPFAYGDVTSGPAGAGLTVRRSLLEAIFEDAQIAAQMVGRIGSALGGSDDTAIVVRAHQRGLEVRYEPSLVLEHRIPTARTTPEYLLRLYEGIGRGQADLRLLFDWKARNPLLRRLIALKDGLRWIWRGLRGAPPALRREFGALADDVHALHQRQVFGRFTAGWRGPHRV